MSSTPLFDAIDAGLGIDAIAKALADGADPDEKKEGKTFLSWAVRCRYKYIVELLLKHGANSNLHDDPDPEDEGRYVTPLITAARRDNDKEMVELLLKAKADPNLTDDVQLTPLMCAAMHGALENCKLLVTAGADPMKVADNGADALYLAVTSEQSEVVRYLLDQGVDPTRRFGDSNKSALDIATKKNLTGTLAVLREKGFS